jgi:hypothetical protein
MLLYLLMLFAELPFIRTPTEVRYTTSVVVWYCLPLTRPDEPWP